MTRAPTRAPDDHSAMPRPGTSRLEGSHAPVPCTQFLEDRVLATAGWTVLHQRRTPDRIEAPRQSVLLSLVETRTFASLERRTANALASAANPWREFARVLAQV